MDTKCTTETEEVCAYSNVRIEICTSSSSYMFNYQVTVVRKYNTTECSTTYETNCTPAAPTTVDNPKENCVEKPTETCEVVEKHFEPYIQELVPYKECKRLDCDS